ncbi:beta-ketoacyl synthase N-terminal-like domain-containing protein [Streptomyces sp. CY1]|uniref:beta-ketoacyl synthase N-terminal-like domain-containing protein n=1 Tax=Streptomyces sp. CY1 TaxID=3388313 RepID=UPI00399F5956
MSSTQKFAIVGINCRLPGARDAGKYWSNLKAGTESITTWSLEELRAGSTPSPATADRSTTKPTAPSWETRSRSPRSARCSPRTASPPSPAA